MSMINNILIVSVVVYVFLYSYFKYFHFAFSDIFRSFIMLDYSEATNFSIISLNSLN